MQKKIICFGLSSNLGGIETFLINTWRRIDPIEFTLDFVKFEDIISFEDEVKKSNSKVFKMKSRRENYLKHLISLIMFFYKHPEYQIVHLNMMTCSNIEPLLVSKLFRRKVIFHSHSEWKGTKKITKFLHYFNKPIVALLADLRVSCSESAGNWMFGNRSFTIIPNAIDVEMFLFKSNLREEVRRKLSLENNFVLGHVGNFVDTKNHAFLIDIFYSVLKKKPTAKLLLIGTGKLQEEIKEKVRVLGLDSSIIFLGKRKDVNNLMQAMDVFIFPSKFEGLPLSLIEAQASGLPTVVSKTITHEVEITDLIEKVSLEESPEVWSNIIVKQVNNLERNSYLNIVKSSKFDMEMTIKLIEEMYRNALISKKECR